MTTEFLDGKVSLHAGDCREVIRTLVDASIDSVVTDPPYALVSSGKRFANSPRSEVTENTENPYGRTGRGFMGQRWDNGETAFASEFWGEILRVLKPGGHVVAFGGTRSYHRLACAIEDAGFEIRDQLAWAYGSGFPKSHDVSKGIDRAAGAERPVTHTTKSGGLARQNTVNAEQGFRPNDYYAERGNQFRSKEPATAAAREWQGWGTALKPSYEPVVFARKPGLFHDEWATIAQGLGTLEARLWSMLSAKHAAEIFGLSQADYDAALLVSAQWNAGRVSNTPGDLCGLTDMSQFVLATASSLSTVFSWRAIWAELSKHESMFTIETGSKTTIDWRTLKFSLSKIMPGTIIQAHKTGQWSSADACLAGAYFNATLSTFGATLERSALASAIDLWQRSSPEEGAPSPAWEPIVLARKPLSGTVAETVLAHGTGALNIDGCRVETSEDLNGGTYAVSTAISGRSGSMAGPLANAIGDPFVQPAGRWPANIVHDGSDEVVAAFPQSNGQQGVVTGNEPSSPFANVYGDMPNRAGRAEPRGDSGSAARFFYSAKAGANDRIGSKHPTVKPVDLMQWLCRLVTPPGGTVLDPFAGTGTTGEAAWREGFSAVLIEREADYQADIARRMQFATASKKERREEHLRQRSYVGVFA